MFIIRMLTWGSHSASICHPFPFLPVNVSRCAAQTGATEIALWFVCSLKPLFCFSVVSLRNSTPTTILHPVSNNVSDIFQHDRSNPDKAKIKRRLLDYSLTCVLLSNSSREAENKNTWKFLADLNTWWHEKRWSSVAPTRRWNRHEYFNFMLHF